MSRQKRRDHEGAIQHVMLRTLPEIPLLFRDEDDRRSFTLRLARVAEEEHYRLLAVALMPNHVHVVGQTGATPLWCVMKRVATGYASTFNRKYRRRGYVLENRYRSKLVSTRDYLETVIAYVLLNPLRGGVVRSLEDLQAYCWTSLPALLGNAYPLFTDVPTTLSVFGATIAAARRALLRRLRHIVSSNSIEPLTFEQTEEGHDDSVGPRDPLIVRLTREHFRRTENRIHRNARIREQWTMRDILNLACSATGAQRSDLDRNDRTAAVADARAIAAHLLCADLGFRGVVVAGVLGLSESGVSKAIRRGRTLAADLGIDLDSARNSPNVA